MLKFSLLSSILVSLLPTIQADNVQTVDAYSPKSFGTGRSQITVPITSEFTLYNYTLSSGATHGVITHWWITGEPTTGYGNPTQGSSVADYIIWRFYVDGETTASIEVAAPQAALIGNNSMTAPWGNDLAGKNADFGGWHINIPIPFQQSIKVTLQYPSYMPSVVSTYAVFAQVRGVENLPITIGAINLPSTARLVAQVRNASLQVLDFHNLLEIPEGTPGCVLAIMIDMILYGPHAGDTNSLEGCWRGYEPPSTPFPGTIMLGTGGEDYPESAYYFNAGLFRGLTSGLSVFNTSPELSRISFYKTHHRDPLYFRNGFRLEWRNGDITDPATGEKCYALNGTALFNPTPANVSTLAYAYTW